MLSFRKFVTISTKRLFGNVSSSKRLLEEQNQRSLIKLSGKDVSDFLQGLITNDVKHLQNGPGSMYTMFLNSKGRVLYDSIVYRTCEDDTYLVECDTEALEPIIKHLKIFRLRRKLDIEKLENFKIYALFNPDAVDLVVQSNEDKFSQLVALSDKPQPEYTGSIHKDIMVFNDPRVNYLGSRIIAEKSAEVEQQMSTVYPIHKSKEAKYRWFRYKLGVGEGINDIPPGTSFPLECNCDFMHGVSFHKGCYIGQELTARTYHTGVIRKRFMPLYFIKVPTILPKDDIILHEGTNLGKLRGVEGDVGLGLLRINQSLEFKEITVGNGIAKVVKPSWWPLELPKKIADKA